MAELAGALGGATSFPKSSEEGSALECVVVCVADEPVGAAASRSNRRIAPAMAALPTTGWLRPAAAAAAAAEAEARGVVWREALGVVEAEVELSVVPASTRADCWEGRLAARRREPRDVVRWPQQLAAERGVLRVDDVPRAEEVAALRRNGLAAHIGAPSACTASRAVELEGGVPSG